MAARRPRQSDRAPGRERTGTSPRTCNVQQAPAPLRHRQAPRQRSDRLLFPPASCSTASSAAPCLTSLSGRTTQSLAVKMATAAAPPPGTHCSMNGTPRARADRSVYQSHWIVYGTVDWLFREYKASKAYLEKVAPRSRPDYERTMLLVTDIVTKKGDRIGDRRIRAISPRSARTKSTTSSAMARAGRGRGKARRRLRLCRRAWRVVHRLHPHQFNRDVPNPWEGVTKQRRTKATKAAVTRDQVYAFAWGCIEHGQTGGGCRCSHLLRMAAAAGKRSVRISAMDGLPQQGLAERDQNRAPQDRRRRLASARRDDRRQHSQILRRCRGDPGPSASSRHTDDPQRGSTTASQAILVWRNAEDRSDDACRDRPPTRSRSMPVVMAA